MPSKSAASAALAASIVAVALVGVGASTAVARPNATAQDQAFVTSNAQSNLAEIALGTLGEQRAGDAGSRALAQVTLRDHTRLQANLTAVAKAAGLTLPSAPNAMQQATAAALKATPAGAFDLAYAKAEVLGHQLAIAAARTETRSGGSASITSYATGYIPIATGHLDMAAAEVSALTGSTPTAVSAGSGGHGQTDTEGSAVGWTVGLLGGLVVAGASGTVAVRRRSQPTR